MHAGDDWSPARRDERLVALDDGYRESTESWAMVLRDLKRRGMRAPVVAVGDGALGFWAAVREVWPETAEQRDWFHKLGNILDKLPKRLQPKAKRALHEIMAAETQDHAEERVDRFVAEYAPKYPKAAACLADDRERLLTFFACPAELDALTDDERDRITVCDGAAASARDQRRGLAHKGLTDGVQAARDGATTVAPSQQRTPAAARARRRRFVDGIQKERDIKEKDQKEAA